MAKYTIEHNYDAFRDGKRFGPWAAGDEVEIDDVDVDWVRRDSPGVLAEAKKEKAPAKKVTAAPPPEGGGSAVTGDGPQA